MRLRNVLKWVAICLVAGQLGLMVVTWLSHRRTELVDAVALGPGGVFKKPREDAVRLRKLAVGDLVRVRLPRSASDPREWLEVQGDAYVRAPLAALPLSAEATYVHALSEPIRDRPAPGGEVLGQARFAERISVASIPQIYGDRRSFQGALSGWRLALVAAKPRGFIRAEAVSRSLPSTEEYFESSRALLRSGNLREALQFAASTLRGGGSYEKGQRAVEELHAALARVEPAPELAGPVPALGACRPLSSVEEQPTPTAPLAAYASLWNVPVYSKSTGPHPSVAGFVPSGAQVQVLGVHEGWAEIRGPSLAAAGKLEIDAFALKEQARCAASRVSWAPPRESGPIRGFVQSSQLGTAPLDANAVRAWARDQQLALGLAVAASLWKPTAPAPDPEWSRALVDKAWAVGELEIAARAAAPLASQDRAIGPLEVERLEAYGCWPQLRGEAWDCRDWLGKTTRLTQAPRPDVIARAFLHGVLRNPSPDRLGATTVTAIWMGGSERAEPDAAAARLATFEIPELPGYSGADLWVEVPAEGVELGLAAGDAAAAQEALFSQRAARSMGQVVLRPQLRTISRVDPSYAKPRPMPPGHDRSY